MEFTYLTPEEFAKLSDEEKTEYVRNLIHSEAANVHAAFLNPKTGETVEMRELVEQVGEERGIEIIKKALGSSTMSTSLTGADVKELLMKAKRGECTDEELAMLDYVMQDILNNNNHVQFEQHLIEFTLNLINYSQQVVKCNTEIVDLLSSDIALITSSNIANKDGALSKYTRDDVATIIEIYSQIADDIYNTWSASCTTLPAPELIIGGLLQLTTRIAAENNITFSKAEDIADVLGVDLDELDKDTENGSNEPCEVCQPILHPIEE